MRKRTSHPSSGWDREHERTALRISLLFAVLLLGTMLWASRHHVLKPLPGLLGERLGRGGRERLLDKAEASRLHPPKPFDLIHGAAGSMGFLTYIITPNQSESAGYPKPEFFGDGSLLLRQPKAIPIGKSFEVTGAGVRDVHGAHRFETCLDLAGSKLKARDTRLSWAEQVDWEGRHALEVDFHPGSSLLTCPSARMLVPAKARKLCLTLRRDGGTLSAHVSVDSGEERPLCEASGPPLWRPARQVELTLLLARPPGSREDRPYLSRVQDEYRFSRFRLVCADPAGCKARAD